MSAEFFLSKFFKKISWWWTGNVWPWREICWLREELRSTRLSLQAFLDQEAQHRSKWMRTANVYRSAEPFTEDELGVMNRLYDQGYGWNEAVNLLNSYGQTTRTFVAVNRG